MHCSIMASLPQMNLCQGNLGLPPGLVKLADGHSAAASSTKGLDMAAGYTRVCLKETNSILYSNQQNAMTPDTLFKSAEYQVTQ